MCCFESWNYILRKKSDATKYIIDFHKFAEQQLGVSLKAVQTYGGGEFKPLSLYLQQLGILHRITGLHMSEQNVIGERKHRHIVESGLTLMAQVSMPLHYWSDAFFTAAFLLNRLPTRVLYDTSPHEMLFKKQPDYLFVRVFGCLCFPHLRSYNADKLDFRSSPYFFLGYCSSYHGYQCLDATSRIYISTYFIS